jgi:cytochrome c oxidase subunit 2
MRETKNMQKKVERINKIRTENSKALVAKGEEALEPYTFDYLLLCNKICGASHYNMQMKITVVVTRCQEEMQKVLYLSSCQFVPLWEHVP